MNRIFIHRIKALALLFGLFLIALSITRVETIYAHPLNNGYSELTIDHSKIGFSLFIPEPSLLSHLDTNKDGTISDDELNNQVAKIQDYLMNHIRLENNSRDMEFTLLSVHKEDRDEIPGIAFELQFKSHEPVESLTIHYNLLFEDSDPDHLNFMIILDGENVEQAVFDASQRSFHYKSELQSSILYTIWKYTLLGLEHILKGYDHLLFLLLLLLAVKKLGQSLLLVTVFTIAHSITLLAAMMDYVSFSAFWIETAIALTIVFVALENLFLMKIKWRPLEIFLFGLIHGLGFASVLNEIGLPDKHYFTSLISFNAGVEIGQIAGILVVLPLLFKLRTLRHHHKLITGLNVVALGLAIWWLIERTS